MERVKKFLRIILLPHGILILLCSLLSAAGLCWVFLGGNDASPLSYVIYLLSFYSLTVLCIWMVPFVRKKAAAKKQAKAAITQAEREETFQASLRRRLFLNLIYAVMNLTFGLLYHSTWLTSISLYYAVLAVIHLVLAIYHGKLRLAKDPKKGWNCFQLVGVLLFILHLTMTGLVFQIIWQGQGKEYPGFLVFAMAAYTFYRLIGSIIQVIQCRKNADPILGAAKNISLTEAMISLFFLQTAMFSAFGGDFEYRQLMNSLTGGAVCFLAVLGSLGMIVHGQKRKMNYGENENGK